MRHRKIGKKLSRQTAPRQALRKGLATSLVLYETVKTTEAKAKALRPYVERLITLAKQPTLANRRLAIRRLASIGAVRKLFEVLGPRYQERRGGYIRIVKLSRRSGDRARLAQISLV